MRQSKFAETQIVATLREVGPGCCVNEIWRKWTIASDLLQVKGEVWELEASGLKMVRRDGVRE